MADLELVECPSLHAKLPAASCVRQHVRGVATCATCPLGAHRATVAGHRVTAAYVEPAAGIATRRCCNPGCGKPSQDVRYCARACKMAADRIRARICHCRKAGRLADAEELQRQLDDAAVAAGWDPPLRITPTAKVRNELEVLFGDPWVLDGRRLWPMSQVWPALGYAGGAAMRMALHRWSDVVEGEDSWVLDRGAISEAQREDRHETLRSSLALTVRLRVFTEVGLWKICLLSRRPEAAPFRARVLGFLEAIRTMTGPGQVSRVPTNEDDSGAAVLAAMEV